MTLEQQAHWIETGLAQEEFVPVETPCHPDSKIAMRFWNDRPADGIQIGRDVPSRAISSLLSRIVVFQPVENGRDFKVYLVGGRVRHRFGRDITGELLSQLYSAEQFPQRLACHQAILATGAPSAALITYRLKGAEVLKLELLRLPVVAPNGVDRWVLAFVFYF